MMHATLSNVLAILCMAIASYACRAGGYWLFSRIEPSPALRNGLSYVPGALFLSYVVPAIAAGGPKEWIGAAATALAVWITGSVVWPIFIGVAVVWLVWLL